MKIKTETAIKLIEYSFYSHLNYKSHETSFLMDVPAAQVRNVKRISNKTQTNAYIYPDMAWKNQQISF